MVTWYWSAVGRSVSQVTKQTTTQQPVVSQSWSFGLRLGDRRRLGSIFSRFGSPAVYAGSQNGWKSSLVFVMIN